MLSIPGPSALTAALSVAGQPTDRFVFEGYLPARQAARRKRLAELAVETRTLVFYETPHRLVAMLNDAIDAFSADRPATLVQGADQAVRTACIAATLARPAVTG
ncbi:MAG: SAM-dependent methyltransferase [Gammaproteobacteria bacterium]|nr:SAM-dependent methyltransferase [Gammaproteobacteria bacterium]